MLQHKNTAILSEMKVFFTSSEKACETIFSIVSSLKLDSKRIGFSDDVRTRYPNSEILSLLLLFPLLGIDNVRSYTLSFIQKLFLGGKDVFYRFKNDESIDWRSLAYRINKKLIATAQTKGSEGGTGYRCLIVDDTDLPKTGWCIELVGRIWSHVSQSSILGFKGLFLGYHDGKSFYGLDFSLHGEKGKNEKKPYGLTSKQTKARFDKKRDKYTTGYLRKEEYFKKKTDQLISMVKTAINKGIRFDYLLVDSWFTNHDLIVFVLTRKIKVHLLGMAKMGKTKYLYQGKKFTAKELIDKQKRSKKIKRSKTLNLWYATVDVDYKGNEIRLFFCKMKRGGNWNLLLTTNCGLELEEAYRIYSIRWSIEVFFKENKQYLGLGKCQSQDFDAQIADTTISMLQYNILSLAKRFLDYESFGELFRQSGTEALKLTIAEKIWWYLIEILTIISDVFEIELEEVLDKIANENQAIAKLISLSPALDAG